MDWFYRALRRSRQGRVNTTPIAPRASDLEDTSGFPKIVLTQEKFLMSQGLMLSEQGSALFHGTTRLV